MIEFILKDFPHVSMLQSSAEEIFAIIGRKIDKEGAMLVEDIKIYLGKIQKAILEDEEQLKNLNKEEQFNNHKKVTLKQKSYPLRELMTHAIENQQTIIYNKL